MSGSVLALEAARRISVAAFVLGLLWIRAQGTLESDSVRLGVILVFRANDHVGGLFLLDPVHEGENHVVLLVKARTG